MFGSLAKFLTWDPRPRSSYWDYRNDLYYVYMYRVLVERLLGFVEGLRSRQAMLKIPLRAFRSEGDVAARKFKYMVVT